MLMLLLCQYRDCESFVKMYLCIMVYLVKMLSLQQMCWLRLIFEELILMELLVYTRTLSYSKLVGLTLRLIFALCVKLRQRLWWMETTDWDSS